MTKKKLNNMEYAVISCFLIKAFFIGITFNYLTKLMSQDSWIVPIASIFIGLLFLLLINYIINYKENLTIIDKVYSLFKSRFKYIIIVFLIITGIIYNIINTINLNIFIHTQFLNKTPILVITILFLSVTFYILTKGINVIAKTSVIIFYISIFLVFVTFLGLIPRFQLSNLKPMFQYNSKSLFDSLKIYYTFNISPILFLTIIPKSNIKAPKIFKSLCISYIITTIIIFLYTMFTIGVMGIELASIYEYPEFQVLKQISLVGISSRIESILVIQWIFDLFIYNVFIIYYVCNCIKKTIKKDLNTNLIYVFYSIILFIVIGTISKYNIYTQNFIFNYLLNILSLIPLIIVVILCIKIKLRKNFR